MDKSLTVRFADTMLYLSSAGVCSGPTAAELSGYYRGTNPIGYA